MVEDNVRLGPNLHAPADGPEITLMEKIALEDEGVQAALAKLRLPKGSAVVCDPWIYGRLPTSKDSEKSPLLINNQVPTVSTMIVECINVSCT